MNVKYICCDWGFLFLVHAKGYFMPKMKTRKSAAKRYRVTGNGKVRYKKQGSRHILTKKSAKRKRSFRSLTAMADVEAKRAKVMLPYS